MTDAPAISTGLGVQIDAEPQKAPKIEYYRLEDGSRAFRGFIVVTATGAPAWGTLRKEKADAERAYLAWNPLIDMHPTSWEAVEVEITLWPEPLSFGFSE